MELPGQSGLSVKHMSIDAADGASIDLAAATPIAALTGKVTMENGGSLPAASFLWLKPRQGSADAIAPVGADGTFTLQSVRPGEYDVLVSAGHWLAITSLNAKGGALRGHVLKVGSDPIELMATVTDANATVNGVVKREGVRRVGCSWCSLPTIRSRSAVSGSRTRATPMEASTFSTSRRVSTQWRPSRTDGRSTGRGRKSSRRILRMV